MKKFLNVFVVFFLLMCSCSFVFGYDDAYFVEAENGFLANEMEDASKLIDIIHESKISYVRSNLSIHLHESQIKLLKN